MRRCSEEYPLIISMERHGEDTVNNAVDDSFHESHCKKSVPKCSFPRRYGVYFGIFAASSLLLFLLFTFIMSRLGYYDIVLRGPRPQYLRTEIVDPVVIRLAIMSRASNFNGRRLLRDTMLEGIPPAYARVEYLFFIGKPVGGMNDTSLQNEVARENQIYNDLEILDIDDSWNTISVKRFFAIRWVSEMYMIIQNGVLTG